jgi:predicted ATPase/DNA-binding SARP family transcriptional activator
VIELRTLGGLRLRDARGRDLCGQLQPKRLALLAYLAHVPRRFHRRDSLLALFWPELDFAGGRNSLRQALYALRRTLGNGTLVARGYEEIALADRLWSDVLAFESALKSGQAEEALELYQGNLLEGLHVQNVAPDFEDWLENERLRLRTKAVRAALTLMDRESTGGELSASIRWARTACRLDPYNEGILGRLIDLLDRAGDRAGAVRAFEAFARRTREEYDLAPLEETTARIEAVRARGEPFEIPPARQPEILEPLTAFIGRKRALAELEALLLDPGTRLVTATGLGGSGKTRLALQLARRMEGRFRDGVAFVELGDVRDVRGVLPAIARGLGVKEGARQDLAASLQGHLAGNETLLVLDGFERLCASGPEILGLLQASPGLRVLVTSRVPLKMSGEREFPVLPLSLPQLRAGPSFDFPLNSEAVALFVDRARAIRPDFRLTAKNMEAVAEICRRLDGLPLAIELAAARVKALTPHAIAQHLEDRFAFLTGGPVDLPAGQRTLEAAIDWSYALLDDAGGRLFRRLGVFSGGFGLDLAEPLFEEWVLSAVDLIDGLASLVDLSLVGQIETDGEPRFAMLDTVHAYAHKLLAGSDDEDACRRRHAAVVLAWVEDGERHYCADGQDGWFGRLERDHDNIRAAFRWALDREDAEIALRLGAAVWPFWWSRGYLSEAETWLGQILALHAKGRASQAARAKATLGACWIALGFGRYEPAVAFVQECLSLYRDLGDEPGYSRALETLGFAHLEVGQLEPAEAAFEECLERSRTGHDARRQAIALNALGQVALARGEDARAEDLFTESVSIARREGQVDSVAHGLMRLGDVAHRAGSKDRAEGLYDEALATFRQLGQKMNVAWTLSSLGNVLMEFGRVADARERYCESLELFRDLAYAGGTARALMGFAGIAISRGDAERGARLLGGIHELVERAGSQLPADDADTFASLRDAARKQLRESRFKARWSEGTVLDSEAVLALATAEGSGVQHRAIG